MRPSAVLAAVAFLALPACMAPPPPGQRVAEVARETNLAARFGRMELALEHTADGARRHFTRRRSSWGNEIRVLDLELTGVHMDDSENATVNVDIQWMRVDEDTLRVTRVEQNWRGASGDHGWMLVRERRVGGDLGLFGERVARAETRAPREDVQFATKVIR
ncbi:MAG TPA: hypothetical protein VHE30_04690 [Polyangiaceae bacterium]|nr:hypothetical protein [Polyangiaceae bacterium]